MWRRDASSASITQAIPGIDRQHLGFDLGQIDLTPPPPDIYPLFNTKTVSSSATVAQTLPPALIWSKLESLGLGL